MTIFVRSNISTTMTKHFCRAGACILLILLSLPLASFKKGEDKSARQIRRADTLLQLVIDRYGEKEHGLFTETYPINPKQQVTYLAGNDNNRQKQQEVSFLWPYSGLVSGVVSLYKSTGDRRYKKLMKRLILPGLEAYWDDTRTPHCYQSYPTFNGQSDRFYDDNDWLAIDLCDYYTLTKEQSALDKAKQLHRYIYSGWSDELGGGIYWCEQQKKSKNCCSNAPATVLCLKLYQATQEGHYLKQAIETYRWTQQTLCDPSDHVYWDNVALNGKIAKAKYTYNTGQMIQAGVMLYQATGDKSYLNDAQQSARGAYVHFVKEKPTKAGPQPFYPDMPWFNVILFRGLKTLYEVDKEPLYIRTMIENADYAWQFTRGEEGLLQADWSGNKTDRYKWLLNNASMIEFYSEAGTIRF